MDLSEASKEVFAKGESSKRFLFEKAQNCLAFLNTIDHLKNGPLVDHLGKLFAYEKLPVLRLWIHHYLLPYEKNIASVIDSIASEYKVDLTQIGKDKIDTFGQYLQLFIEIEKEIIAFLDAHPDFVNEMKAIAEKAIKKE